MTRLAEFEEIVKRNESLAPYTYLKLGGPAEMLVQPRSFDELSAVVRRCYQEGVPLRVLGSGCNLVVRDEGVAGAVSCAKHPSAVPRTPSKIKRLNGRSPAVGLGTPFLSGQAFKKGL